MNRLMSDWFGKRDGRGRESGKVLLVVSSVRERGEVLVVVSSELTG